MTDEVRTQPEFSPGERLMRIEAQLECLEMERKEGDELNQRQLDRRLREAERLAEEKLEGLRKELGAINVAQKDAVAKAEQATDRRLELVGLQIENDRKQSSDRLGALERGESKGEGAAKHGQQISAAIVTWIGLGLVVLSIVVGVLSSHIH